MTTVVATKHVALARSLGADRVIDHTTEDFTRTGGTYDFVFDAVGKTSFFHCRRLLKPHGTFASTDLGPYDQNVLLVPWSAVTRSKRVIFPLPRSTKPFVHFLKGQMEAGKFRAVIDRRYPLDEIIAAYRYVESRQKTGIVVIDAVPPE